MSCFTPESAKSKASCGNYAWKVRVNRIEKVGLTFVHAARHKSYNHPQLDKSVTRITSFISFPLSAAITFNVLVNGDRRHCFVAQSKLMYVVRKKGNNGHRLLNLHMRFVKVVHKPFVFRIKM